MFLVELFLHTTYNISTQWIILNWKGAKKYLSYRRCCSKMPIIFGITFWFKIVSHSAMGKKGMHYTWHYIVTKDPIDSKPWSVTLNYQTDDESATFKKTISHLIYWLKYFLFHCCCCFPLIFVHQNVYQVIVLGCILFKCHLANETLSESL